MRNIIFYDPFNPGPAMPHEAAIIPLVTTLAGALVSKVLAPKPPDNSAALAAQTAQQNKILADQKATQLRAQTQANTNTTTADASLAALQSAALARRSGQGSLAFTGPSTSLKTTLGG